MYKVLKVAIFYRFAMMDQYVSGLVKQGSAKLVVGPLVFQKYMQEPGDKIVPGRLDLNI